MKTNSLTAPCQNCPDRFQGDDTRPNCHTTCRKYLDYAAQNESNRQQYKQSLPPVINEHSWCGERGFRKSWNRSRTR